MSSEISDDSPSKTLEMFKLAVLVCTITSTKAFRVPANRAIQSSTRIMASKDLPESPEGWKTILSPMQFKVLREKSTEPSGYSENTAGELEFELKAKTGSKTPQKGHYDCVGCGTPLYSAVSKFDSGCGWPAYYEGLPGAIKEIPDADGRRIEIVCNNCDSHLGHTFKVRLFIIFLSRPSRPFDLVLFWYCLEFIGCAHHFIRFF